SAHADTQRGSARNPLTPSFLSSATLGGLRLLVGRLGLEPGPVGRPLGRHVAIDELYDRHRRIVAMAKSGLHDAQIATIARGIARRDRVEQTSDRRLAANRGDCLAPGMKIAALAQ